MFDWNDLRYFLAVARLGSTTAAAKALRVNQSTVQRRLVELERRMGHRLVVRHATGYQLTEIGTLLLPAAEAVGAGVTAMERQSEGLKRDLVGVIRLTCPEPLVSRIAEAGLLERFRDRHPGLAVEFVMSDRYVDIAAGEADVALRSGEPGDPNLVGRKVADSIWAVYASPSYVQRHGRPREVADLVHHALIGFDGIMQNHRAARWLATELPGARIVAHNNSVLGVMLAVKSGLGIAPLPTTLGDAEADLEQVLPPVAELTRGWYLLAHPDLRKSPRIAAFFDFIADELPALRSVLMG